MSMTDPKPPAPTEPAPEVEDAAIPPETDAKTAKVEEIGGPKGPDPTRFGDWSVNGRCYDF